MLDLLALLLMLAAIIAGTTLASGVLFVWLFVILPDGAPRPLRDRACDHAAAFLLFAIGMAIFLGYGDMLARTVMLP